MSALIDDISRVIASPVSRRRAFKMVSGAVGGALLASLGLGRAARALGDEGDPGCPNHGVWCGGKCYPKGTPCCGGSYCDDDHQCCGDYCCGKKQACCGRECCNHGSTCCGRTTCCPAGVACCDGKCCSSPRAICCGRTCCQEGYLCCDARCVKERPSPSTICRPVEWPNV